MESQMNDPFEKITGKFNFPGKKERDTLSAIVRNLDEGIMTYCSTGNMSVTQYLYSILRAKGDKEKDPSLWNNDKFLGKLEKINEELSFCPPDVWGDDKLDSYTYKRK